MLHAELVNPLSQKNRKVWEETDRDMISSQGVLDSNVPLHQQSNGSRLKKKKKRKKGNQMGLVTPWVLFIYALPMLSLLLFLP
jgi:hypothetical protein